ncbi:MAG: TetR family transcriptional regulator [Streptosporangiales bacterium]|nr:TetR family transcriptional regulator [Streptosporangiales bacterium]
MTAAAEVDGRRERGLRRRRALLDAAARVIARDGIASLTHRSVAAEAGLPKSAATYYFASLDDLLVAALLDGTEHYARDLAATIPDGGGLAELARHAAAYLTEHRDRCLAAYELYLLAARRPELREAALSWPRLARSIAARHTSDPAAIAAFVAAIDGLSMQALLTNEPLDADTLHAVLRRTLDGPLA